MREPGTEPHTGTVQIAKEEACLVVTLSTLLCLNSAVEALPQLPDGELSSRTAAGIAADVQALLRSKPTLCLSTLRSAAPITIAIATGLTILG